MIKSIGIFMISQCWMKQQQSKTDKTLVSDSLTTTHAVASQDSSRQQQGVILKLHLEGEKAWLKERA